MITRLIERWRGPKREYVAPIIYPGGGKLRDHHVWARSPMDARLAIMECYDTGAFIVGPVDLVKHSRR